MLPGAQWKEFLGRGRDAEVDHDLDVTQKLFDVSRDANPRGGPSDQDPHVLADELGTFAIHRGDEACFEIHAECVAQAETIQDIEACEALFDNCIDPGPCESEECEPGCPQEALDACVASYAGCVDAAMTARS